MRAWPLFILVLSPASAIEVKAPIGAAVQPAIVTPAISPTILAAQTPLAPTLMPRQEPAAVLQASAQIQAAAAGASSEARGRVVLIENFPSKILGNSRTVAIYLPPGYDPASERRYPVLYVQDGQNIFNPKTAYQGVDWSLGETSDRLIKDEEIEPAIIVAPYNAGEDKARRAEYMPKAVPGVGGGKGELYGRFLIEELKPAIDAGFHTDSARSAIMGSSLGGLIAMHLAWKRPDVFFAAAPMSVPWELADAEMIRDGQLPETQPRLWIDMGTREGNDPAAFGDYVRELRDVRDALAARGWVVGDDLRARIYEGAEHNERAWRARAGEVLKFLFPAKPAY